MTQSKVVGFGSGVEILDTQIDGVDQILTPSAVSFVVDLSRRFEGARQELLRQRSERWALINQGALPDFLAETKAIRDGDWSISPLPSLLQHRHVEITGPVDRKMMINALNSGAQVFMADFEDANSPTWANIIAGHINLRDAIDGTIEFTSSQGKRYGLKDKVATLMIRPRGWHLIDKHFAIDGRPVSASLLDFGLFFFHGAKKLLHRGSGPYIYLPKLESRFEARLWNDVFNRGQDLLGVPRGTIKATILIETILAAFEMDEILYELKDHSGGLNAGRWDYLFSVIKTFRGRPDFVLPDRAQVTMTVPFMRAYTQLIVQTCHRRNAPAIGGMAAFIPSRSNPKGNAAALARVREDKIRECIDGFDGTWVAHPDLVPVASAVFDKGFGLEPGQIIRRPRGTVAVAAAQLLDVRVPGGFISERGLYTNVNVSLRYLASWLRGEGAAAIDDLMEDVATAEIARAQIWQWLHHGARLVDGRRVSRKLVEDIESEVLRNLSRTLGNKSFARSELDHARAIFEQVALSESFVEFLTLPAYDYLP